MSFGITSIVCLAVVVILIALPPQYDPAIRWKIRNERKRRERDERHRR